MAGLPSLNSLPEPEARSRLLACCGSSLWACEMARLRPFRDEDQLFETADTVWKSLERKDWLEAFRGHPMIGDKEALKKKWAGDEQSGVAGASEDLLEDLARGNRLYLRTFGYLFITCATGKSAPRMLLELSQRLGHEPERELAVAAEEQRKITRLRLDKLLKDPAIK